MKRDGLQRLSTETMHEYLRRKMASPRELEFMVRNNLLLRGPATRTVNQQFNVTLTVNSNPVSLL